MLKLIPLFFLAFQQETTFKSTSNLVILDVTVRDKSGKEITNLEKNDFVLMEDGKPQNISVFELQRLGSGATQANTPTVTPAKVATTPGRQQVITTTPGRVQYQDRRLMVMLFDLSSMKPAEQLRAQDSALQFVTKKMGPSDLVSVMTFSSNLQVTQDFTDDRDRLTEVLRALPIGRASDLATNGGAGDDNSGEDNGDALNADETEFNIFNTDRKLSALESAAKMLGALPEKKALLYFSSGVSKSGVENQAQLRSAINAAVRANVAFYPIDSRGLTALPPGGDASSAMTRGNGMFTGAAQSGQRAKFNDQQETLVSLAADTGGKAFLDNNDLALGITQAQDDVKSYYILGFYSANEKQDGKFRRIQIKLKNNLNAKIDYRSGYFGPKTFAKFSAGDKESQLEEALMLGDPVTDLPLAVETDYFRLGKTNYFVPVSLKIPGSSVSLGKKETDFDFIGQVRDSKGKLAASVRDGIKVKLGESSAEEVAKRAIAYDTGFTLSPGVYRLKMLVRENQSGKMGTYEAPFTIPDLTSQTGALRVSSVVYSSQRQPVSQQVGNAGVNKKDLAADPLIQDGQKLVPSITRVFRKDQSLYVYMEVYDAALAPTPSVSAVLTFYRGSVKAFETSPVRVTQLALKRNNTLPVQFQVPLGKLLPGKYTCQVNLIDEQAKRFAFPRTEMLLLR